MFIEFSVKSSGGRDSGRVVPAPRARVEAWMYWAHLALPPPDRPLLRDLAFDDLDQPAAGNMSIMNVGTGLKPMVSPVRSS